VVATPADASDRDAVDDFVASVSEADHHPTSETLRTPTGPISDYLDREGFEVLSRCPPVRIVVGVLGFRASADPVVTVSAATAIATRRALRPAR
jgi:hypothetical protein